MTELALQAIDRRTFLRRGATIAAALGAAGPWRVAAAPAPEPYSSPPDEPIFLLEGSTVEDHWGVKRRLNPLVKSPRNPIISKDRGWEGSGPYVYGSVLYDAQDRHFKCWYTVYHDHEYRNRLPGSYMVCFATSEDGYTWHKPELDLVEWKGSRKNNLVNLGRKYVASLTVVPVPAGSGIKARFVTVYLDEPGVCLAYSDDGARWRQHDGNPIEPHHSDTQNSIVHDPVRRTWMVHLRPPIYAGPWKRRIAVMESADLKTWTRPQVCLTPDEADPPEFYGMPVFRRGNLFWGLLQVFDASEGRIEIELPFSADGRNWQRVPPREMFLKRGAPGEFDAGMITTAGSPVIVEGEMRLYYGGWKVDHRQQMPADVALASIGMASVPVDRFYGVTADQPNEPGSVLTRPLMLKGNGLELNARAEGEIRIALLDAAGKELPGFGLADSVPARGDGIRQAVAWRQKR
ncbi:MAG: hypothetical protein DMG07_21270, partial [Acidobacteria bacterium]